jgi:hypothetical protein
MEVRDDGSLDGRRVGWNLLISEPRISISISRFISHLMSFGLMPKP